MTVPRKMTTHEKETRNEFGRTRNKHYMWVQYISLDREVLTPSPCE